MSYIGIFLFILGMFNLSINIITLYVVYKNKKFISMIPSFGLAIIGLYLYFGEIYWWYIFFLIFDIYLLMIIYLLIISIYNLIKKICFGWGLFYPTIMKNIISEFISQTNRESQEIIYKQLKSMNCFIFYVNFERNLGYFEMFPVSKKVIPLKVSKDDILACGEIITDTITIPFKIDHQNGVISKINISKSINKKIMKNLNSYKINYGYINAKIICKSSDKSLHFLENNINKKHDK